VVERPSLRHLARFGSRKLHFRVESAAVLRGRACIARQAGDIATETVLLRQALELWEASTGPDSHLSIEARLELANALLRADQPDAARPLLDAVAEPIDGLFVSGSPQVKMRDRLRQVLR
ncbi:tetratricopeptide repeat protein, partial [Denitratimonas sp. CY0512]|uniref:tetratricopeptide repeat protein n=1 Tax=Denitratimonas sp. CY0512 TaxID=3131940 RepID=UPI0030A05BEB